MDYVQWEFDTQSMESAFDRYDRLDRDAVMSFEAVLTAIFNATQEKVHVISGKLKASGRIDSDSDEDYWLGTITYGGPGVDYAGIEQRRHSGDGRDHDYMDVAIELEALMDVAVRNAMD